MVNPFNSFSNAKRKAKRKGKAHGRQGLPSIEWTGDSVPYLEGLHAIYGQKIESMEQKLRIIEGQSLTSSEEDYASKKALEYQINQNEKERSLYEAQLTRLIEDKIGEQTENPIGRAARNRHVPMPLYLLALFALAIGEYFVTLPAVEVLMNDYGWKAVVITGSFAVLSILGSHIIGLTFKIDIDRDKPQPMQQRWGALLIFIFVLLVVLMLSSLRSGTVQGVPFKFGLSSDILFGTILFFIIQMSFIFCAIALSYYNHSELESEISKTKNKIKKLTYDIQKNTKANLIPDKGNLTTDKKVIQVKAIITHMRLLEAEYRELCSIYRGANLLAQKDSFSSAGRGLTEKELKIPEVRIQGEI